MNALIAITPARHAPSETATQHMRMLCRLADLGMACAETAAEQARSAIPDLSFAFSPETPAGSPRTSTRTQQILAFTGLSRIVTHAVSLHATLEAGLKPSARAQPAQDAAEPTPDLRRDFLQQALDEISALNPHFELSQYDAHEAVEARLLADGNGYITLSVLLPQICTDLGLPPETQPSAATLNLFACFEDDDPPDPLD